MRASGDWRYDYRARDRSHDFIAKMIECDCWLVSVKLKGELNLQKPFRGGSLGVVFAMYFGKV